MPAQPKIGLRYRQRHKTDKWDIQAEIVQVDLDVHTVFGTFENCIKIKGTNSLHPDWLVYQYYAPGIGRVKTENISTDKTYYLIDIL